MSFTYNDLLNLEYCVESALYDTNSEIKRLRVKMTDNSYKRRLEFYEKVHSEYSALYKKLKEMERECDNDIRKSV